LDRFKNAYLMDFGIAKIMSSAGGSQMTATGTLLGTPAYMAPEMWKMAPVDGRADIYSLGLMLYEILTGELPYYGETPFQYMYAHLHEEVPRISSRFKGFSPDIDTVILRATAKEPSGRYATASEMANAFNEAIRNTKSDTPVQGGRRDPSNKLGKIFVVLEHSQSGLKAVPNLDDFIKKGDKGKAGQPMRVHSDRMDRILGELEKMDMADTAKTDQLRSILSQGKMNEAFLGVNVQPLQLPPSLVESTGQNNALLVIGVDEPSPAQAAGIFIGDILMKIEGVPVRGHDDLKNILKTLMPNQSAEVDIVRTGQLHKLTVQLVPKIT
jgi:serine/threonine protein kinase